MDTMARGLALKALSGGASISSSVSVVQSKSFIGDSAGTATLALNSAPAAGNIIVAMGTFWTSSMAVNSAWGTIRNVTPGASSGVLATYRLVTDADTASVNIASPMNNPSSYSITLFELSGALPGLPTFGFHDFFQASSATAYSLHTASYKNGSVILGVVSSEASSASPTSITGATIGTTVTGTTTNASPRGITPFTSTGAAKGAAGPVTANFAGSAARYGFVMAIPPA